MTFGERRSRPRFDVHGALWGHLELTESVRICNVSKTGTLVDSPIPAALESTPTHRVIIDGDPVAVATCVPHVTRVSRNATGFRGPATRYLIGLEFLSPPESVLRLIEQRGELPL